MLLQYVLELPFSVLRWLTIPATNHSWGPQRRLWACASPAPLALLALLSAQGGPGFGITLGAGFPLYALLLLLGLLCSVLLLLTSRPSQLPRYHALFGVLAFVGAIVWLSLLASELVALLQSLGVMFNVSSGVLGLTVLALGNSVGDFVADTAVARHGLMATGVASCFGSPLLNDVVGLGITLTVTTVAIFPESFHFQVERQTLVAYGFLGVSLVSNLLVFSYFNYRPPKIHGVYLIVLYLAFIVVTVLMEGGFL